MPTPHFGLFRFTFISPDHIRSSKAELRHNPRHNFSLPARTDNDSECAPEVSSRRGGIHEPHEDQYRDAGIAVGSAVLEVDARVPSGEYAAEASAEDDRSTRTTGTSDSSSRRISTSVTASTHWQKHHTDCKPALRWLADPTPAEVPSPTPAHRTSLDAKGHTVSLDSPSSHLVVHSHTRRPRNPAKADRPAPVRSSAMPVIFPGAAHRRAQDEAIAAEAYIHLYPPRGFASPGARQVSRGGSLVVPSPGDPQERPCDSDGDCCRRIVVN